MTGDDASNYVGTKLEELENKIESELKVDSLADFIYAPKAEEYMTLTPSDLDKMTPSECASAAYTLSQYAMYIRIKSNKSRAIKTWAEKNLSLLATKYNKEFGQYDPRDYKIEFMAINDSYGKQLQKIISDTTAICNTYYNLSEDIIKMSDTLKNLGVAKGRDNG